MFDDRKLKHSRMATIIQNLINNTRNGFEYDYRDYDDEKCIEYLEENNIMTRQEFYEIQYYDRFSYNKEEE